MRNANSIMVLKLPGITRHIHEKALIGQSGLDALLFEKLRREPPTRCFYACAGQFSCQCGRAATVTQRGSTEAGFWTDERTHLSSTDMAPHEDSRFRKLHFSVIAQRHCSFVPDPEQKDPERVTRLFDFIKQDECEVHVFRVILIERFLGENSERFPPGGEPMSLASS